MRQKFIHTFLMSLEWRAIAYVITNIFFFVTTHQFWTSAGLALLLQAILFVAYMLWYFVRHELSQPLFPGVRQALPPQE